jgi:hypothetical protein
VEEGDGEGAKHEKAANENQLILLLEPIFHGVPDNQRRHHEQEHKVDENQNGSDPLSEGILIELIDELCKFATFIIVYLSCIFGIFTFITDFRSFFDATFTESSPAC